MRPVECRMLTGNAIAVGGSLFGVDLMMLLKGLVLMKFVGGEEHQTRSTAGMAECPRVDGSEDSPTMQKK